MELQNKATSLWGNFFKLGMPQIRAFHMTWFSFFEASRAYQAALRQKDPIVQPQLEPALT